MTKSITYATYKGTKKVCQQGKFSGHTSRDIDFSSRDFCSYNGRLVLYALQGLGGGPSSSAILGIQALGNAVGVSILSSLG